MIIKKRFFLFLIPVFCIMTGWLMIHYHSAKNAAFVDEVWVEAASVQVVSLPQEVHAIGTLTAKSVEITPEFAGHVEKILFQDGSFVKYGTLLIQLNDAVYKAKEASANAKFIYSKSNSKRMRILGKLGAVTEQAIDQAEADLKEKKAEADESKMMMSKMKLIAPFEGMAGKSKINIGDYVTVGQSLVTLTDTKHLRIEYNIPEKYLSSLKLGQIVTIKTSAYPKEIFKGKVSFISPTINTDNRSISLYAELPNENGVLKAGMFVDVKQSLDSEERALMIPAKSLVPILDAQQVYKIVDRKAYAVTVLIGKRTDDKVQILAGLKADDIIITDGQLKVKNNMSVKLKHEKIT